MFRTLLIVAIVALVGGGLLYNRISTQQAQEEVEQALYETRRSFADKAASIVEEDTETYLSAMKDALRKYEQEIDDVYADHPEWHDTRAFKALVEERFESGEIKEAQRKSMLEGYNLVRSAYDTLLAGSWTPVLTQVTDDGVIRMDIYEVTRTQDSDGNPQLEAKVFLWGVEDNTRMNWGQLSLRYWTMGEPTKLQKRQMRRSGEMKDEVELVLGRAEGSSSPYVILQSPAKYIDSFPPYLSVALLRMPAMPKDAHAVDFTYTFEARTAGRSVQASFEWEKLAIPPQWQLGEGEVWNADVVEATEEEIAGTDDEDDEEETN
jgi:hypothetical protein